MLGEIDKDSVADGQIRSPGLTVLDGKVFIPEKTLLSGVVARPGDLVIVSGTLVEGVGNEFSDIDIHVLCKERPKPSDFSLQDHHRLLTVGRSIVRCNSEEDEVFLVHSPVPGTAIKIDVEYDTLETIERIERTINELFDYASQNLVLLTKEMSERDQLLFHRIETGKIWSGSSAFRIDPVLREKLRYLLYRWQASDFMMLLDCVGAARKSEWLRAVDIARECLMQQSAAFVALLGGLNTRRKWVSTYLRALGSASHPHIVAEFMRLYPGAPAPSDRVCERYVVDVLDFIDRLYDEGRQLLAGFDLIPLGEEADRLLANDRDHSALESMYSEMEYEYRRRAYVPVLSRTAQLIGG